MKRIMLSLAALIGAAAASPTAKAGDAGATAPCYRTETRKVMVPTWTEETRHCTETRYRMEKRKREVTVHKCVAETKKVPYKYTMLVPQEKTRKVTVHECKAETKKVPYTWTEWETKVEKRKVTVWECVPVTQKREQCYTEYVRTREKREGVRWETVMVPEVVTRTVCKDMGHWEMRYETKWEKPRRGLLARLCGRKSCEDECLKPVTVCKKVWCAKPVTHTVQHTVQRCKRVAKPYSHMVTVCKPITKKRWVDVCTYVNKPTEREIECKICVAVEKKGTRTETHYKMVPVEKTETYVECVKVEKEGVREETHYKTVAEKKTETYHECVPYQVKKAYKAKVCKMVPKTVCVKVPVCDPCCR